MIYLFNSSEEVIKIVPSTAIRSFYQTQTLTSEKYISDRVDIELKALPEEILKQIEYVAIPDIQDKYRFHLFFVVREATEGNITEITGVQSGIEELRKSPVYDIRPQDRTVRFAAEQIIQGTNWTVGYAPDDVRVGNMNVYYSSAFEGLKTLCEKTDVEMQFFVEINGNKVGNRYIEFKKKIGKNVGRRVVYGHNALQIIKEVEKTDLVTALVGRGRGEEVSSAEENAGGVAGYGRKITFEDIEWKKANGDPVDKPLGQKYVEIPEMTAIYGVQTPTGKRPKFGFIEFDTDDKAEVLRRTYEALQWVSRPKVELKTSSVYLKDTYIGDTVRVIRHDRGLAYETRVFEIKIDRISGRCEIKLGDKLSGNDGLSVSKLSSQITNLENSLSQTVQNIVTNLPSADGFTRNWYIDQEPSDPRVGDTWFKPDPEHEGHTIMLTWNGEVWDEILRTYNDTRVADKLAEIDTQTQAMEAAIQENEAKAREAFEQAGASADLASEAQRIADETKQAHASLSQEVNEAKADLIQQGNQLVQIQNQYSSIEQWKQDTDPRLAQIVSDAQNVLNQVNTLDGRLDTVEPVLDELGRQIGTKLTQADLSGYVTSAQLTAKAGELTQEISRVEGLIPTEIGGRNYYLDSARTRTSVRFLGFDVAKYLEGHVGETWTFSFDCWINEDGIERPLRLYRFQDHGRSLAITQQFNPTKVRKRFSFTGTVVERYTDDTLTSGAMSIYDYSGNNSYSIANIKLEIGTIPTDWTPAPEDYPSYAVVNEIKSTADANTAKISDTQGNLNSITQTVNSIKSSVEQTILDPNTGKIAQLQSQITQQAGEISQRLTRTEVESAITGKGYQTKSQVDSNITGRGYITNAALTPYATTSTVENKVRETADGINRTITEIRGLIPAEIGGRNYYLDSARTRTSVRFLGFDVAKYLEGHVGETWTFSFDCWINEDGIERPLRLYRFQDHGRSLAITQQFNPTKVRKRFSFTGTVVERYTDDTLTSGAMSIYDYSGNNSYSIANIKLEIGTIPTDWTPAPEDLTLPFESFKNEYDRTAKSVIDNLSSVIQTDANWYTTINNRLRTAEGNFDTLSRTKADLTEFQTVRATTDVYEQILGKSEGDIQTNASRLVMASDVFQTEVSAVSPNTYESRFVNTLTGGILVREHADTPNGFHYTSTSTRDGSVRIARCITSNGWWTIKFTARGTQSVAIPLDIDFCDGATQRVVVNSARDNLWTTYKVSFNVQNWSESFYNFIDIKVLTFVYLLVKDVMVYKGTGDKPYTDSFGAVSTKVTQLAGSWAVQNLDAHGKLLNQINLLADGTNRIDGRLTHITGQTKIDNAVITSAMIQSVDAGKIITGTLDAAKARIVNLDINSLTGDKSELVRSGWNAINSRLTIDGSGLKATHSDGSYTMLGANGLEMYVGGTGYRTNFLTDTFLVTGIHNTQYQDAYNKHRYDGMQFGHYLYTLPSIYRGRNYSATCSLADVQFYDTAAWVLQRVVSYVDKEKTNQMKANGQVAIVAYAIYVHTNTSQLKSYPVSVSLTVTL